MKNLFIAILALGTTFSVLAKTAAVPASDLRVYLNPGHGSWSPDDRPFAVYYEENGVRKVHEPNTKAVDNHRPDTLAFYESNTDLWKAFGVLEELRKMGLQFDPTLNQDYDKAGNEGAARDLSNNIVMSRTKNGPFPHDGRNGTGGTYNRDLHLIAVEAQSNNFDLFFSIHSNGGSSETENYHLLLYRGYDTPTVHSGATLSHQILSREIATAIGKHGHKLPFQYWTSSKTAPSIRGDVNFYGVTKAGISYGTYGYLGVLHHIVPGCLAEGYFHSYAPSRHRAMNFDADIIEGIIYSRGIAEYFGLDLPNEGTIYGLVRSKTETFSGTYYTAHSATNDGKLPLNSATVTLSQGGTTLETYKTDNYYNGVFVFKALAPGRYTITVSKPGYDSYSQPVIVKANEETTPEIFLALAGQGGSYGTQSAEGIDEFSTFDGAVDRGQYYDRAAAYGITAPETLNFTELYSSQSIPELAGFTVKRVIARDNMLYILALNGTQSKVVVYDHVNRTTLRTLSTSSCAGDFYPLCDIAMTSDGFLIGINSTETNSDGTASTTIYRWPLHVTDGLPYGEAIAWRTTNTSCNLLNAKALAMTYSGSSLSGHLYMAMQSTGSEAYRVASLTISNGIITSTITDRLSDTYSSGVNTFGEVSMYPLLTDGHYLLNGSKSAAKDIAAPSSTNTAPTISASLSTDLVDTAAAKTGIIRFGGKLYLTALSSTGLKLIDITNGIGSATSAASASLSQPISDLSSGAAEAATQVNGASVSLALLAVSADGRVSKLLSQSLSGTEPFVEPSLADNSPRRAPFAYDLAQEGNEIDGFTLSFRLTDNAPDVQLVFTDVATGNSLAPFSIGRGMKGLNTFELSNQVPDMVIGRQYRWTVKVLGTPISTGGKVYQHHAPRNLNALPTTASPNLVITPAGGVQVISDHNSPYFGYIVTATGFGQGFRLYAPDLTAITTEEADENGYYTHTAGSRALKASLFASPYRLAQRNGKVYAADYSDSSSNIWEFDPADPGTIRSLYSPQATWQSGGIYKQNGNFVGSTASALAFTGSGTDTKFWMISEDYSSPYALLRWNIGTSQYNTGAPSFPNSQLCESGLLKGSNSTVSTSTTPSKGDACLCPTRNGLFIGQMIESGGSESKPALMYIKTDGTITYNSGSTLSSCSSGVAVNSDETLLALAMRNEGIRIYNLTWNTAHDTPTLGSYTVVEESNNFEGEVCQLQFDPAGNLYAFQMNPANILAGFNVYTRVQQAPVGMSPAPDNCTVTKTSQAQWTIHFDNSSTQWSEVHAYIWNDNDNEPKRNIAGWPGDIMTKDPDTDIWNYTFPVDINPTHVIFNNGNDGTGNQTSNLVLQKGKTYFIPAYTVYWDNTGYPQRDIYCYMWDESTSGNPKPNMGGWPGVKMKAEGNNIYSYTALSESVVPTNVIFNVGNDSWKTTEYEFTNGKTYTHASEYTVYWDNKDKRWATPHCYIWQSTDINNGWPGQAMTPVEGSPYLYSFTTRLIWEPVGILFTDGDANNTQQTTDDTFVNGQTYGIPEELPIVFGSRGNYAYDLKSTRLDNGNYTVEYTLTGDVAWAEIILTDIVTDLDSEPITIPADGFTEGSHAIEINTESFTTGQQFVWRIEVENNPVASNTLLRYFPAVKAGACGGVKVIRNPQSTFNGYILTSNGYAGGYKLYGPDLELVDTYKPSPTPWSTGTRYSPYRIAEHPNGSFYTADWSDSAANFYIFNPENSSEVGTLFSTSDGFTRSSTGAWSKNGAVVGGSNTSVAFHTDSNGITYLWSFVEDMPFGSSTSDGHAGNTDGSLAGNGNVLCRYTLDEQGRITGEPTIFPHLSEANGLLSNNNIELLATNRGLFICQKRTTDSASIPCLLFVDYDGNITFNSGNYDLIDSSCRGIAINQQGNVLAVSDIYGGINIFSLRFTSLTTPALTLIDRIEYRDTGLYDVSQMDFDAAGNLYVYRAGNTSNADRSGLWIYALSATCAQFATSPAPSIYNIHGPEGAIVNGSGKRGEYAYDLRLVPTSQDGGYELHFKLTGDAPLLQVRLWRKDNGGSFVGDFTPVGYENGVKKQTEGSEIVIPVERRIWQMREDRTYNWGIVVHSAPVIYPQDVQLHSAPAGSGGGVLVIDDIESPLNGYIVTATGYGIGYNIYNPEGRLVNENGAYVHPGAWTSSHFGSPYRLGQHNGIIYAADWADASSDIHIFDPVEATFGFGHPSWMNASTHRESSGRWVSGSTEYLGSSTNIIFEPGTDIMWGFIEDINSRKGILARYVVDADGRISSAPQTFSNVASRVGELMENQNVALAWAHGGLFVSQLRTTGNNTADIPGFIYGKYNSSTGNFDILFNSATDISGMQACGGGIAVNAAGDMLAVSEGKHGIMLYDLEWNSNGAPVLSNKRKLDGTENSYTEKNSEVSQLNFDCAGNLFAFYRHDNLSKNGVRMFTIATQSANAQNGPRRAKSQVTGGPITLMEAPKSEEQTIKNFGLPTGVDDVAADSDTPSEPIYYNLQGVRMPSSDNLAPGIYIKVIGTRAQKVHIP